MANIEFFLETSYFWLKEKQNRCYFINDKEFKYVVELDGEIEKNYILGYINSIKRYGFEISCIKFNWGLYTTLQTFIDNNNINKIMYVEMIFNVDTEPQKKLKHAYIIVNESNLVETQQIGINPGYNSSVKIYYNHIFVVDSLEKINELEKTFKRGHDCYIVELINFQNINFFPCNTQSINEHDKKYVEGYYCYEYISPKQIKILNKL